MTSVASNPISLSGEISINTENILPIIKRWLYSEHEIFIRELVSNAFDAITKLNTIAAKENLPQFLREGKIDIKVDPANKTITVSDNGLGLDPEEIQKYINQIAFSGARDFIKKYKDKEEQDQIIGQFGLGFYSAFMVSDVVEIQSLSYKPDSQAIHWSCDGSTHFSLKNGERTEVGTDVILRINTENETFLKEDKIIELVKKFANFFPLEIRVNGKKANYQNPIWAKQPTELKDKDYEEFYHEISPFNPSPLFWIHLNVEYPFHLKGILYFPSILHELDSHKGKVSLYSHQVFVTDNGKEVIPEFLTLLQGAIDCPDLPLNVSRSQLQKDPYVQKISRHIVKKIADKLNELFKNDKAKFEGFWSDIHPFIKYGMMQDNDFYEKVKDIVIFKSSLSYFTSIPEYNERNKEKLQNKVLYSANKDSQATYIQLCKDQGLEVIYLDAIIDSHFIQFLESKDRSITFSAVDSSISEHILDKDKEAKVVDPSDNKTADEKLADIFKRVLKNEGLKIEVKSLKSETIPGMIIESETSKRLKNMRFLMKQDFPKSLEDTTLVINSNNAIVKTILKSDKHFNKTKEVEQLCLHLYDLVRLSHSSLSGEQLKAFIERTTSLLSQEKG